MRFRVVLPVLFGVISTALIAWDLQIQHAFLDQASAVSDIQADPIALNLIETINAPVFALTSFLSYPLIQAADTHYPEILLLLPILLWWWWIGTRLDFGILGQRSYPAPRRTGLLLCGIAVPLLWAAIEDSTSAFRWWQGFHAWRATEEPPPVADLLTLVPPVGHAIWYAVLAVGCCVGAVRLARGRFPAHGGRQLRGVAICCWGFVLLAETVRLLGFAPETIARQWRLPSSFARISGTITDEIGNPVKGVLVEIAPFESTSPDNPSAFGHLIPTDAQGRYEFNRLTPGAYVLGVNIHMPPASQSPYAKVLYPGAWASGAALRIEARANEPVRLRPLMLKRLPMSKVAIEVRWSDGSIPGSSYVRMYNLAYTHPWSQEDPTVITGGTGEVMVPSGFDYETSAWVTCDTDAVGSVRASPSRKRFVVTEGNMPRRMVFAIPGPPCTLSSP